MTLKDWIRSSKGNIARHGWRKGLPAAVSEFATGICRRTWRKLDWLNIPPRTTIWHDDQWDVCVALDACRIDAYREVAPEYDWLPDAPTTIYSPGSMSEEWYQTTFAPEYDEEMARCGLVTWNAYASHTVDEGKLAFVDHMWRDHWDDDRGCVPPEAVTGRAIGRYRMDPCHRLVVHYQQPHAPYRALADAGIIEPLAHEYVGDVQNQGRYTVWDAIRCKEITHERAWAAYLDNLRWALDDIERLLNVVEGDVVLTADHGDLFGEWGLYAHPRGVPLPELIKVPWAVIDMDAVPDRLDVAGTEADADRPTATAEERLKQLGYL